VTGKPVIATPMAEAILQRQYVTIASSVDEWEVALCSALSVDVARRRQAILELLAGESWDHKTATFLTYCTDAGELGEVGSSR